MQLVECGNRVVECFELFGGFAKVCFGFEVLLEVVFAKLVVELQHVVEVLNAVFVVFPQLCGVFLRHRVCFFPFGL